MRHRKRTAKLGRTGSHRNAMLANLVCSLIKERRVTTTLAKAKAARSVAEKMVTLGKKGAVHHRRLAAAHLRQQARNMFPTKAERDAWRQNEDVIHILFDEIAPIFKERRGGYTRIIRLHQRQGDAAQLAILEWVEAAAGVETSAPVETKPATEAEAAPAAEAKPAEPAKSESESKPESK